MHVAGLEKRGCCTPCRAGSLRTTPAHVRICSIGNPGNRKGRGHGTSSRNVRANYKQDVEDSKKPAAPNAPPSSGKSRPVGIAERAGAATGTDPDKAVHAVDTKEAPTKQAEVNDPAKPAFPAKRAFAAVAFDKAMDTAEDVLMHLRRKVLPPPTREALATAQRGRRGYFKFKTKKPVVLVLGAGWAAHSMIKVIDTDTFDVVVVSPRNHFVFTPMLPSTAVGTVEFRSLLEPIRVANPYITYLEADCDSLDIKNKVALCTSSIAYETGDRPKFEIAYDVLAVAVGEQSATFGVPGVEKYCYFMKEVSDCVGLRKRIQECFELAGLPGVTEEDRRRILHFVVVGGGPTGVEFAGTLNDFVRNDLRRKYPELMPYVRTSLLQSAQGILTQFAAQLQMRAMENFQKIGVDVRTGVRVVEVNARSLVLKGGETVDYGLCLWSTGNATRPLVKSIVEQLPQQQQLNASVNPATVKLGVDPFLRIIGAPDAVALGDCSMIASGTRLPATAQVAGQQGAYAAHVINRGYLLGRGGLDEPPPCRPKIDYKGNLKAAFMRPPSNEDQQHDNKPVAYRSGDNLSAEDVVYYKRAFEFLSLGLLAYVGNDKALTQVEAFDSSIKLYGDFAYLLWRSVYITKQVSFRNRVLILFDWLKAKVFGRDLSQF